MDPIVSGWITQVAGETGVDPDMLRAFIQVESGGSPFAVRYEPAWKYFLNVPGFAFANGITVDTEAKLQAMSWGPMQVMGSVARELKYGGPLQALSNSVAGLRYAALQFKRLAERYEDEDFLIAAYNAGTPIKTPHGDFSNQNYVDKVKAQLKALRG